MAGREVEVLLVEDDAADLELTLHTFHQNKLSNQIHVARDGEEALDFLFCRGAYGDRDITHTPKLILTDLKLPKVDGLEVIRQLREHPQTKIIPVVVLTSSAEQQNLAESYKLGINSYIQKPVDFEQFRAVVRQLGLYWLIVNQPPPPIGLTAK